MELLNQFKIYLFSLKNKPSEVTVKNYLADIRKFINWFETTRHQTFHPDSISFFDINTFKRDPSNKLSASSMDRHLSSLRKFFKFLTLEGIIAANPFDSTGSKPQPASQDPWHLKEFKDHLYVYNASKLTIKNYLIDIKQFLTWAEVINRTGETYDLRDKNIISKITPGLIEEYKTRLYSEKIFSGASINRKLSSLRRYIAWATQERLIQTLDFQNSPNDTVRNAITADLQVPDERIMSHESRIKNTQIFNDQSPITNSDSIGINNQSNYSSFPPFRIVQKISKGIGIVGDMLLVAPFVWMLEKAEHVLWKAKGRQVFAEANRISNQKPNSNFQISNLPKVIYNPLAISTANFPVHKKLWHIVRYTRPNWYKRYHKYALAHYFNFAILIIFMSIIGFGMYNSFFAKPQQNPTLAALPNAPLRILSFQGRLTDNSDNPITTPTFLRFIIYNDSSASSSARLWEEVRKVSPDADGIFNVLLGSDGAGGQGA